MTHTRLWAAAGIIAIIILISFVLSVPRVRDGVSTTNIQPAEPAITSVALRDSYKKGVHTITGYVLAPDACGQVGATANIVDDNIQVAVTFTPSQGVCLELQTRLNFSTTVSAPAGLPITATINGALASTTTP